MVGSQRVPAVRFADGRRAQGTRPLARALDELQPEPRLVPADPRVEEAELWGDEVLQQWARRMVVEAGLRDPDSLHARGGAGQLGPLLTRHDRVRPHIARGVRLAFRMSSEQLREDPGLDQRADIYSLGCILYEMLTGSPPFTGANLTELATRILRAPPPSAASVDPAVPAAVDRAIGRALAKSAAERFPGMAEFAAALPP